MRKMNKIMDVVLENIENFQIIFKQRVSPEIDSAFFRDNLEFILSELFYEVKELPEPNFEQLVHAFDERLEAKELTHEKILAKPTKFRLMKARAVEERKQKKQMKERDKLQKNKPLKANLRQEIECCNEDCLIIGDPEMQYLSQRCSDQEDEEGMDKKQGMIEREEQNIGAQSQVEPSEKMEEEVEERRKKMQETFLQRLSMCFEIPSKRHHHFNCLKQALEHLELDD